MRDGELIGRLSIVATPIGNLEDITLRALRTLRECDGILAEDTRRTRVLLSHHGIATPVRAFHAHTSDARLEALASELAGGKHLALVTDAGTPLVSDPGARLVRAAVERGVRVEPIPGASALLAALSLAAPLGHCFTFAGFLPRSGGRRKAALRAIATRAEASVLFEAPSRLQQSLHDLAELAPEREAVVCRELTKIHEEAVRGTLSSLAKTFEEREARGEITIVVDALAHDAEPEPLDDALVAARIDALLEEGMGAKEIARELAAELGLPKREVYQRVLARGS
ncbi:MAG: 16S rRNA (cytidine(1402)-2'-O)-methyltransferase [Sandaracinaceae bacterium]|nr:16S rRNA (cytidine(1402)-2'-O)-methyltransferase [Sandaracinaceae bacterium]